MTALAPLGVAVRWMLFAAMLVTTGAAAFHFLVLRRISSGDEGGALFCRMLDARAARLGMLAATLAVIAAAGRLPLQIVELYDDTLPLFPQVQVLGLHTMWGAVWIGQLAVAIMAGVAFAAAREGGARGWATAALCSALLAATPALSGHAIGSERLPALAVVNSLLHVIAGGMWIGAMAALAAGLVLAQRQQEASASPAADMVSAFSKVALIAAPLVLLTGLFASWLHLGTLAALWQSRYGLTLLVKVALVGAVLAFGAWNWRRGGPDLRKSGAAEPMLRSVRLELVVAALVLLATALLVVTPPPGSE